MPSPSSHVSTYRSLFLSLSVTPHLWFIDYSLLVTVVPFQAWTSRSECPATKGHAENSSRSLPRARVQFPGGELSSVQSSPVGQSCPTLRPHGLQPVRLLCLSPTPSACSGSVHRVGDAIQPPHPLSSPFPPAFSLSQHQGLFK